MEMLKIKSKFQHSTLLAYRTKLHSAQPAYKLVNLPKEIVCEDEIKVVGEIKSILQSKYPVVLTEDNNAYLIKKKVQKLSDAHHIQLLHYRERLYCGH